MLTIRALQAQDPERISAAFTEQRWDKPLFQFLTYLSLQKEGVLDVLVAEWAGAFAGYLLINWSTSYVPFREAGIPMINDLNVLQKFQRRGIASRLMDAAEARVREQTDRIGIGVGMTVDYGPAQQLYIKRGYVPDGRGLMMDGKDVEYGATLIADDRLTLHMVKQLR